MVNVDFNLPSNPHSCFVLFFSELVSRINSYSEVWTPIDQRFLKTRSGITFPLMLHVNKRRLPFQGFILLDKFHPGFFLNWNCCLRDLTCFYNLTWPNLFTTEIFFRKYIPGLREIEHYSYNKCKYELLV